MFTDLESKKKAALKESTLVDEMYDLLNMYFGAEAKLPTSDQVKIDDLHESVAQYMQVRWNAEATDWIAPMPGLRHACVVNTPCRVTYRSP
eukprot:8302392-Pyramimonas_sp.AAC.1